MFTGIVRNMGDCVSVERFKSGVKLMIRADKIPDDIIVGESVCVDGVCLTINEIDGSILVFEVSEETLRVTTLGNLNEGGPVNMEYPLRVNDFVGGHFVAGHVDFVSEILEINVHFFVFGVSREYMKYIAEKGSIAVNGVSLTVNRCGQKDFSCNIISMTRENTNLGELKVGDLVNVEVDMLARYVINSIRT